MFITKKRITVLAIVVLTILVTSCSSEETAGMLETNEKDGAQLVYIPEGEFLMGSSDEQINRVLNSSLCQGMNNCQRSWFDHEQPIHTVNLDAYWIYKTEVTNSQYRKCIQNGGCVGDLENYPEDNYPAVFIFWDEADSYCDWAGGRLPTEAEWEKAARGTDGRTFPWGEEIPTWDNNYANFGEIVGRLSSVGSYPKGESPYGVLDMAGNAWEWVADWYDENYYVASPSDNPTGPSTGDEHIIRGGDWINNWRIVRTSTRGSIDENMSQIMGSRLGFRCVILP